MNITERQLLEKGFDYYKKENSFKFTIQNMDKGEVFKLAFPKKDWIWETLKREYGADRDCGYGGYVEYSVKRKTEEHYQKEDLNYQISLLEKKFKVKLKVV